MFSTVVAAVVLYSERLDAGPRSRGRRACMRQDPARPRLCAACWSETSSPQTWPPAMGGCFRCHEVEQRELRAW